MPHSYKGRTIGVVTARSVFREFGAKIVIGGKKVTDDYHAQEARERGDVEGELAAPDDRLPAAGDGYNRNQYVAWHGASAVYHTNLPNAPMQGGKGPESKRKRIVINSDNWMLEHAREAKPIQQSSRQCSRDQLPRSLRYPLQHHTVAKLLCSQHMLDGRRWMMTIPWKRISSTLCHSLSLSMAAIFKYTICVSRLHLNHHSGHPASVWTRTTSIPCRLISLMNYQKIV